MILGIDEVGRGAWAGPLVVGAVVLGEAGIDGLTDSKLLSKKRRIELDVEIRARAKGWATGWVASDEIDEIGMSEALRLASIRAVEQIKTPYHEIIIDGTVNFFSGTRKENYVSIVKKADLLIPSVSAASIIAKVARDNFMAEQDSRFPGYGFARHVGYGTKLHQGAIENHGTSPIHRMSFAPMNQSGPAKSAAINTRTTKYIGDLAESATVEYLLRNKHEIKERNWKTKYCEIDIVSTKNNEIYFTEVRYRKSQDQGGGLLSITKRKQHQMEFAAKLYMKAVNRNAQDPILAVASVTGDPPELDSWIPLK